MARTIVIGVEQRRAERVARIGGASAANPPGLGEAVWAIPGSVAALVASYYYGKRKDAGSGIVRN